MPRVVILTIFTLYCLTLTASSYLGFNIKYYSNQNGFKQLEATSVYQSRQGFIWIGGMNTITRWDGKTFTTYSFKNGFDQTYVTGFTENSEGDLIIICQKTILCFTKGMFINCPSTILMSNSVIRDFEIDKNDNLHICTPTSYYCIKVCGDTFKNIDSLTYATAQFCYIQLDSNENPILVLNHEVFKIQNHHKIKLKLSFPINCPIPEHFTNLLLIHNKLVSIDTNLYSINLDDGNVQMIRNINSKAKHNSHYAICTFQNKLIYGYKSTYILNASGQIDEFDWQKIVGSQITGVFHYYASQNTIYIATNNGLITLNKKVSYSCPDVFSNYNLGIESKIEDIQYPYTLIRDKDSLIYFQELNCSSHNLI